MTTQEILQAENLEVLARQVVEGFIIGLHKSPFHGFSVEFAEHRIYNTGEPTKNIDWKVLGRTDKLFVKRFEEETNLRCQLVIDASSSMYFPQNDVAAGTISKIRFSVVAAACFQYIMKKQRDAVGLSVISDKVDYHINARSTVANHKLVSLQMEKLLAEVPSQLKSNTAEALHQIAESIHKRSMVILFSDMMDNMNQKGADELFNALQHLKHNKHEVIVFDVSDKRKELEFDFDNRPYVFVDLETGEKVKLHANLVKEQYVNQMQEHLKNIRLRCAQYRIDLIEADINKGVAQVLMPYLLKRERMH